MLDSNLGMTIVFNGVIYNYVSLRNELIKRDIRLHQMEIQR